MTNIRLSPDEMWTMLEEQRVGIFTTLRGDGSPISLPVWYAPINRRIYLHGPAQAKKLARLRNNPRVSFLCDTGERWVELRAVHLTGVARVVTDESVERLVASELERRYSALRAQQTELPDSAKAHYRRLAVIEIIPDTRFLSWDNSTRL